MKTSHFWDTNAPIYLSVWEQYEHRKKLHLLEKAFIQSAIKKYILDKNLKQNIYLDLGCGPGRIIEIILDIDKRYKKIIGIDGSEAMISQAQTRLRNTSRIVFEKQRISSIDTETIHNVTVVTSIRVLKYIKQREEIFQKISNILTDKGIFIFTVTNTFSCAYFDSLQVNHYKDSISTLKKQLSDAGFNILEITGFQKLPEFVYILFSLLHISSLLYHIERWLQKIAGEVFFSRTHYIVAQKNEEIY